MNSKLSVLLVEDNDFEEMLALRAILRAGIDCEVKVAHDGVEACRILFDGDAYMPGLVLLDLKMPKMSGFELLQRIRGDYRTKRVPVVVHSSSDEQSDIRTSLDLYANSYVSKGVDFDLYESRMKLLLYYWVAVHGKVA